ncbi:MAG TPA: nicotinamide mononucleotide transporter [Flavobacteriales bacterium]|jgi:nicotinamide mononucleotide transporter|nr:nicotinamide mononucleotide transporter [Flavobacteriales bacterium]
MVFVEVTSVVLALLYVVLIARKVRLGWVFGTVSSALAVWLFWKSNLNSEALLYLFYVLAGVYGYFQWGQHKVEKQEQFTYQEWKVVNHTIIIVGTASVAVVLGRLMQDWGSHFPYFDAFTTCFGFLATFMAARKVLSNWIYWIIIDLASAYLYFLKDLNYYSILMVLYTVLAAYGYFEWRKTGRPSQD